MRVAYFEECGRIAHIPKPIDPATDEELGMIPDMGVAETKEAIASASAAFKEWSKTTAKVCLKPMSHRSYSVG